MRQETGSKHTLSVISISVRLSSGGDTFLLPSHLPSKVDDGCCFINIELLTHRAILVPTTLLHDGYGELASAGFTVGSGEEVVSIEDRDITAFLIVPSSLIREVEARFSGCYEFITPLLRRPVSAEAHVLLDVEDGLSTIKVYSKGWVLQFADMYSVASTASVVYWTQRLSQAMHLSGYTLYIYRGDGALGRLLNKNFRNILYANSKRSV